jgi:hypothetical protein
MCPKDGLEIAFGWSGLSTPQKKRSVLTVREELRSFLALAMQAPTSAKIVPNELKNDTF